MQSTNDPRLLIGLGAVDEVARLTIRWPSGTVSTLEHLAPDTAYQVVEPREKAGEAIVNGVPNARSKSRSARAPSISMVSGQ